jgi:hypothetical protein
VVEMLNGNGLLVKPKPIMLPTSCPSMFDSTSNVTNVMPLSFVANGTIELLGHVIMTSCKHYTSFFAWVRVLNKKNKILICNYYILIGGT